MPSRHCAACARGGTDGAPHHAPGERTNMKHLALQFDRGVETVTLNRPEVRNAFNDEVIAELTAVFLELARRDEVRCVVLAGSGPAFCAGADLNWMKRMAGYTREENIEDAARLARLLEVIYR